MTDHQCVHEVDLAKMAITIESMNGKLDKVVECIDGNGKPGMKTEIALNKQSIKRAWWWLAGISLAIMSGAIFVIRGAVA